MKKLIISAIFAAVVISGNVCPAQNPIIQTMYTADPAPMVYNDKLYLYTSHDEDNSTWFTMNDWKLYTTTDMVNWTDHGVVMKYTDFSWAKGDAWAAQCVERSGKFYMYAPVINKENNSPAVGVAVADSPYGPFYDPLGKPLVQTKTGDIDPTVFIDDDGQAYLYWGNPNCYYVKLNENMISYEGEIASIPLTEETFGKRDNDPKRNTLYEEGPWLYKRQNLYYLLWAGGPIPEHLGYSTGKSPTGPWKYGGVLMPTEGRSFTNHPGIVDFRGKTYLFYHNGDLPGGSGFTRSVCVDEVTFNADGSIQPLKMSKEGIVKGIGVVNPYVKNEAETIAWSEGMKASQNKTVGVFVTAMHDGAYIKVRDVDFRNKGAGKFTAGLGTTHNNPMTMEIRLDGVDGQRIGTVKAPRTGGNDRWGIQTIDIQKTTGTHDLYFVFKGNVKTEIMFFDYWMFTE